jgi:folate-binding protein YgfZ
MNQDWQDFLTTQGANIQDGVALHFGDAAAERLAARDGTVLCDLSQFGILKVHGEDAATFMHSLFSSDVKALTPGCAQYSSFNTAKGRALATFLIWRTGAEYFLQLPQSLITPIQKKLSMYVLRAKVKIENVSDNIVCLGLSGPGAEALLNSKPHLGPAPRDPMSGVGPATPDEQHATVLRLDANRFLIKAAPQGAATLWKELTPHARPSGSTCWDWLAIRAGIPFILPKTQEEFVPQMVNLDLTGHVNFKKGCYTGQEIVARMHYLGKPKRRMYFAHVEAEAAPQPGDELFSMEMEGQACGMVVNSAPAPDGGYDLLAVVQIVSHDAFPVHLGALTGARLQFQPLPFPIP